MTTWYQATAGIVEAANSAMAETASQANGETCCERLAMIWQPVAAALLDSQPERMTEDWPELDAQAIAAGDDYVGITSDTRQVVIWGDEYYYGGGHGDNWREFVILDRPSVVPFDIGQRVKTKPELPADAQDSGVVIEIDGDKLIVAWDSGVRTPAFASDLRAEG